VHVCCLKLVTGVLAKSHQMEQGLIGATFRFGHAYCGCACTPAKTNADAPFQMQNSAHDKGETGTCGISRRSKGAD
jgi:hypothetical protein